MAKETRGRPRGHTGRVRAFKNYVSTVAIKTESFFNLEFIRIKLYKTTERLETKM